MALRSITVLSRLATSHVSLVMRCVGLIDSVQRGAPRRIATFHRRCASHHIATQRVSRWDIPAALARLARTVRMISRQRASET